MIKLILLIELSRVLTRNGELVHKHNTLVDEHNSLVDKHNDLVRRYNALLDKSKELQQGIDYAGGLALAAFKRIPPEFQEEMRTDIEFLEIVTREKE